MSSTSLPRRVFSAEEIDGVVKHVKARGDANRPAHLRLVEHHPDHVERRVRAAARRMHCGQGLSFLLADYAYIDAMKSVPVDRSAKAQAQRIQRRAAQLGLTFRVDDTRVSQLRGKAFEMQLLLRPNGKAVGGRGRAADYVLADALRAAYGIETPAVFRMTSVIVAFVTAFVRWMGTFQAQMKAVRSVKKPSSKAEETLHPSVRGARGSEFRARETRTETPPPSAPPSPAAVMTADVVKAEFMALWEQHYPFACEVEAKDLRALSGLCGQLSREDLRMRLAAYLASDGDRDCCVVAAGKHFCRNYVAYLHPAWMFVRDINRFGYEAQCTRAS